MSGTFGRYQMLRKLAVGGMGEVWLARQKGMVGFEKLVVVKRLLPHLSEEQEFINMFFDEARIAALLNHPNIAQIYDLGEVDGEYFIAMEYVHGENLRDVAQRALDVSGGSGLPLAIKCRVISDAAAALDFAHRAKGPSGKPLSLIHRDVSPQNIICGFSGTVKLIDFGVAKAAGKAVKTATGIIKGKYAYMSPEQAKGEDLDSRSDIFGLGTVFYEILTGQRLFKRDGDTDTLKAVVFEKVPPPSSLVKGIPRQVDAIVMKALEKGRDQRFQTGSDFQLAIEEFLVRQRLPATPAHLAATLRELFPDEALEDPAATTNTGPAPAERTEPSGKSEVVARESSNSPEVHLATSPPTVRVSNRNLDPVASKPKDRPSKAVPAQRPSEPKTAAVSERVSARVVNIHVNPKELELRIGGCSPYDMTHGFFFNALFGLTMRVVGPGADTKLKSALENPRTFVDALSYPTPEFLRLLWKAVELTAPITAGVEQSFEDMGVWAMDGLLRSNLGRPIDQLKGSPPHEVLKPMVATLKPMLMPGERVVGPVTNNSALLIFKGEVLPIQFHAGLFTAGLDRLCGAKPSIAWEKTAADRVEMKLRW